MPPGQSNCFVCLLFTLTCVTYFHCTCYYFLSLLHKLYHSFPHYERPIQSLATSYFKNSKTFITLSHLPINTLLKRTEPWHLPAGDESSSHLSLYCSRYSSYSHPPPPLPPQSSAST